MELELQIVLNSVNLKMRFSEITDDLEQTNKNLVDILLQGKKEELNRVMKNSIDNTLKLSDLN
jgi:hypothetical protein